MPLFRGGRDARLSAESCERERSQDSVKPEFG
jgi:hypothetical protein